MNPLTIEWVDKAEGDFTTALRELRVRKSPNYDAACFHAQQCVEKYLKARLQEAGIILTKTHNLTVLLDLLLPVEPGYDSFRLKLLALTLFAVAYRYPGASADKDTAREALDFCKEIRQEVRLSLGLNP
ncbi:HEPN domain protein [Planktothrix tepida]|uniref:HEPN domain protein n=1 Tax=Planktothrix tepida PCC 9214 TaxID=671072 RepID=A0A1J1LDK8_9CYAN|nr:HEPN domain-containing protein [Planktothrix tepida]CAD5917212.1 HEPN domain protein [Planktothrix tepida]CUR30715.1 HEPN domain protein [Planktothrix tepida PCC 9214]